MRVGVSAIVVVGLIGATCPAVWATPPPPRPTATSAVAPMPGQETSGPTVRGELRPHLTFAIATPSPRQGQPMRFIGRASPATVGRPVALQVSVPASAKASASARAAGWQTLAWGRTNAASAFSFTIDPAAGVHTYRAVLPAKGWTSRSVTTTVAPALFDVIVQPQDQRTVATVTNAIRTARASVDIVVYNQGASDIAAALAAAKARLARNKPRSPAIRVMVNGQWNSASKTHTQNQYVSQMMTLLGVDPTTGRSADGVVGFNYSATNFSLTHQKTLVIDARRPDGREYSSAASLPATARAIVATFNLQASGWPWTYQGATPGANCDDGNATCSFVGGGKGTRDFGVIVRRPAEVFTVERVFSSDFAGPTPTEANLGLGLNRPNRLLVWSNGTIGVGSPPPSGFGPIFSRSAGSYPAFAGQTVGSGFYPYPYYRWVEAAQATPDVHLGTVAGNANAVHLGIINRAAAAARAGRPATLFIYNEEDSDDQVSAALNAAAAAGVTIKFVMSFNATYGGAYQQLVTTTRPDGSPVNAAVHLYPTTNDYMYIHAKMIYADLDSDEVFVGSQNFSENSLLQNRELGVHLRQADGTLTAAIRSSLTGTFAGDFVYLGADVPGCPIVAVTPSHTWNQQSAGLNTDTGCPIGSVHSPGAPAAIQESNGAPQTPSSYFPSPLGQISNQYQPPLPQGPIRTFTAPDLQYVCQDASRVAAAGDCPTPP